MPSKSALTWRAGGCFDYTVQPGKSRQGGGLSMEDVDRQYRSHYDSHFAGSSLGYNQIRSAYQFGAREAKDHRFSHEDWAEAEPTLRQDWEAAHSDMSWDDVRDAIFTGWQVAHTTSP
jgi:hypothetical protein